MPFAKLDRGVWNLRSSGSGVRLADIVGGLCKQSYERSAWLELVLTSTLCFISKIGHKYVKSRSFDALKVHQNDFSCVPTLTTNMTL